MVRLAGGVSLVRGDSGSTIRFSLRSACVYDEETYLLQRCKQANQYFHIATGRLSLGRHPA